MRKRQMPAVNSQKDNSHVQITGNRKSLEIWGLAGKTTFSTSPYKEAIDKAFEQQRRRLQFSLAISNKPSLCQLHSLIKTQFIKVSPSKDPIRL